MASNHQFSIAVHIMAGLGKRAPASANSAGLAQSVNARPSFVRRTLSKLAKAHLVRTTAGKLGSCSLAKKADQISMLDIYRAVDAPPSFAIHTYEEEKSCVISCGIKPALKNVLDRAQASFEASLDKIKLSDVIADIVKIPSPSHKAA